MRLVYQSFACLAAGLFSLAAANATAPTLKDVLNRMDAAAANFHAMSADISKTQHTAVLTDNSTDGGPHLCTVF